MLAISGLEAGYGHIRALGGVDVSVKRGEFVAILGPTRAGKSTLLKTVIGVLQQQRGTIQFEDKLLDSMGTA